MTVQQFASAVVLPGNDGKSLVVGTSAFSVLRPVCLCSYEFESVEVKSSDITVLSWANPITVSSPTLRARW